MFIFFSLVSARARLFLSPIAARFLPDSQVTFGREQLKKSDGSEWDLEELALEVDANEVADAGEDAESDTAGFVKVKCWSTSL